MNRDRKPQLYFVSALAMLLLCGGFPSIARAQSNDPLEVLRRNPPRPGVFRPEFVELGREMLQWQIERDTMNRDRLESKIAQLQVEIEEQTKTIEQAKQAKLVQSAFANDTIREQLLIRVLERLLEARVDIAANEALAQQLEERLKESAPNAIESKQLAAQAEALQQQLALVRRQFAQQETLRKQKLISDNELLELQIQLHTLESKLKQLELAQTAMKNKKAVEFASPLADVNLELHQLKARETVSRLQLEELAKAAEVARYLRQSQCQIDQLRIRLEVQQRRVEEVSMELEEAKLFLDQINKANRDAKPSQEAPSPQEAKATKDN